ncbi:putative Haloalkane dehalogenase [Xylogone sp. PMI_703]|nr:putative Haloalkane dehalogenase [Xylogone sp. PMI_703]
MATLLDKEISSDFPYNKKKVEVFGSQIAYIDVGQSTGPTTVFLHGNPTSSYLWRNIIPYTSEKSRCIAPDLIGFGDSDKVPGLEYRVADHQRYLDAFLDAILPEEKITLVLHDWGSALGFDWACRHEDRIRGLAFMEFIVPIDSWESCPKVFAESFQAFRTQPLGRELLIDQNMFVEGMLPRGVIRQLTDKEMAHYRRPFLDATSREPVWRFPNEVPIMGSPPDVWDKTQNYMKWLTQTNLPKLFFWVKPGIFITEERANKYIKELKNTETVYLGTGSHFVQEDYPHIIGQEIAAWMPAP